MVRILFNSLITSRLAPLMTDLPPPIAFISYLLLSIRVGKTKGSRPRTRLAKASMNSISSGIGVEGSTATASTGKARI
jgi:hypothetical protein